MEVSTFSLFDEILSKIFSSTPSSDRLNSELQDQFTNAENISIFDKLFQNNLPISNSLSTSSVFDFIVNTTMKKMTNDQQLEISKTTLSPFDITNFMSTINDFPNTTNGPLTRTTTTATTFKTTTNYQYNFNIINKEITPEDNFMSTIDDSPNTTNGPLTRTMVTLIPNVSFSNEENGKRFLDNVGLLSTPSSFDVTNFMIVNGEILEPSTLTPLSGFEEISLRQNETFSDLLFSNFSIEKTFKTVSNGVHIEREKSLLENFSSGQQNSENSSDSSLPRIGRSHEHDTKPNKLDLKKELLSSHPINPINFPGSKIFQKENGRIVITKLKSHD